MVKIAVRFNRGAQHPGLFPAILRGLPGNAVEWLISQVFCLLSYFHRAFWQTPCHACGVRFFRFRGRRHWHYCSWSVLNEKFSHRSSVWTIHVSCSRSRRPKNASIMPMSCDLVRCSPNSCLVLIRFPCKQMEVKYNCLKFTTTFLLWNRKNKQWRHVPHTKHN